MESLETVDFRIGVKEGCGGSEGMWGASKNSSSALMESSPIIIAAPRMREEELEGTQAEAGSLADFAQKSH